MLRRIYTALSACISNPPRDWRRPRGRSRQTWLRTIEKDLQERTEYGTVDCLVLRTGSCSVAKSRGNSYAPVVAHDMMVMMMTVRRTAQLVLMAMVLLETLAVKQSCFCSSTAES